MTVTGRVLGVPGGSVSDGANDWAASSSAAEAGRSGEVAVAQLLDPLAQRFGVDVLHDLRIPVPGVRANVDHAVVSGNMVMLVDAKRWQPGFYWTIGGNTRRGFERVPHVDSKTMKMAAAGFETLASKSEVSFEVARPLVAVVPSKRTNQDVHVWAVRVPGAKIVTVDDLVAALIDTCGGFCRADRDVTAAMAELLIGSATDTFASRRGGA